MLTLIIVCMKGISSVGYGCCVPVLLPLTDYPSWVFRVAWCVVPTLLCLLCSKRAPSAICNPACHSPSGRTRSGGHQINRCRLRGLATNRELPEYASTVSHSFYLRSSRLAENSGFKGEVYANPDRKLYDTLDLVSNLQRTAKGEERRSYLTRSLLSNTLRSIWVRHI